MIPLEKLHNYALFGGLDASLLNYVVSLMEVENYSAGEVIVREGELDHRVFFIEEGEVSVWLAGVEINRLGEGDQFGEMHLIDIQPRSATVRAESAITLLSLDNSRMFDIRRHSLDAYLLLVLNCTRNVSRRLRDMNQRFVDRVKGEAAEAARAC